MDKKKWLTVCEALYEIYPQPCLYFSLLYGNDKDLLRRISQRYIYSIRLKDVLPKLLIMMLEALLDRKCPSHVAEAIYIVAPFFMRAVCADVWGSAFEKAYATFNLIDFEKGKVRANEAQDFIITGVKLSNRHTFKHAVLLQSLRLQTQINNAHNSLIIAASEGLDINAAEHEELQKLVESAD